ncbi:MAG TPA: PEGA domain-containing protein, partial [Polyangiaceae bacterium]|nr:PEGA domain-containing protein [Polyangiaceae bacterium]
QQQAYPQQQAYYGHQQQPYPQQPQYTPAPPQAQQSPMQQSQMPTLVQPPPGQIVHFPPAQQQGAVETKMSLPRPAAVAQWLMEQGDVEIQGPRSTGVIIAIAALATLCVIGVGALIIFKLQLQPVAAVAAPGPVTPVTDADDRDDTPQSKGGKNAKTEPASSTASAKPTDGDGKKTAEGPKTTNVKGDGSSKRTEEPAGEPPGKLSVSSKPPCDSVIVAGSPAGACPLSNYPLPPGTHRVTLKRGAISKTIVVQIASGQLTSQSVSMK